MKLDLRVRCESVHIWKIKNALVKPVYRVCSAVSLTCQMNTDSKEWHSRDKNTKHYKTWTKAELREEWHKHMVLAMLQFVTGGGTGTVSKGGVLLQLKTWA